jgi:hypothetical protein
MCWAKPAGNSSWQSSEIYGLQVLPGEVGQSWPGDAMSKFPPLKKAKTKTFISSYQFYSGKTSKFYLKF